VLDDSVLDDEYGGNAHRTWGTSISIGGVSYATSIFWQPLQNPSDPMQEIESSASAVMEGADLFCIKGGRTPQFGICVSQEGFKSGQYVAAVSLVGAMDNLSSFIGVFKVPEGWWYVCVRNDIILSDGDILFLNEEEAKNQFLSMLVVPDWGMKIAPSSWEIEETKEISIEESIQRGPHVKLKKIKGLRGTKLLLIVVLSIVVGGWLVSSLIDKLLFTPVKKPVVVPIRPKVMAPVEEVKPIPKPWESLVNPQLFVDNCFHNIKKIRSLEPPGWQIGSIVCNGKSVSTSWTREVGFLSIAQQTIEKSDIKLSSHWFNETGTMLSASIALPEIPTVESAPKYNTVELRNVINNEFQSINLPISLSNSSFEVVNGNNRQTFRQVKFQFNSPHDPVRWLGLLIKYSGIEFNLITYSPKDNNWHYEGVIYVL